MSSHVHPARRRAAACAAAVAAATGVSLAPLVARADNWTGALSNTFGSNSNWLDLSAPSSTDSTVFDFFVNPVFRSTAILTASQTVASMLAKDVPPAGPWEFQRENNAVLTVTGGIVVDSRSVPTPVTFNGFAANSSTLTIQNDSALNMFAGASYTVTSIGQHHSHRGVEPVQFELQRPQLDHQRRRREREREFRREPDHRRTGTRQLRR